MLICYVIYQTKILIFLIRIIKILKYVSLQQNNVPNEINSTTLPAGGAVENILKAMSSSVVDPILTGIEATPRNEIPKFSSLGAVPHHKYVDIMPIFKLPSKQRKFIKNVLLLFLF